MNWMAIVLGILFSAAGAASGGFLLLYRARGMRRAERPYGMTTPHLQHVATAIGALGGLTVCGILMYFLSVTTRINVIEWIGRTSYLLVAGACTSHLLVLVHTGYHLYREERAWSQRRGPQDGTLGCRRLHLLQQLRREHRHYLDLRSRDDQVVDELIGVLGTPLLNLRRDLSRIPFYGYLGTVCGILLMAQELGRINEATETFKVLSSMSTGLVLAFQTTLVALVAFLPLRKVTDYLIQRLGRLEELWGRAREEEWERSR